MINMASFYGYDDYYEKVWWFVAYLNWASAISKYPALKASKSDFVSDEIISEIKEIEQREEFNVKSYGKVQTRI